MLRIVIIFTQHLLSFYKIIMRILQNTVKCTWVVGISCERSMVKQNPVTHVFFVN